MNWKLIWGSVGVVCVCIFAYVTLILPIFNSLVWEPSMIPMVPNITPLGGILLVVPPLFFLFLNGIFVYKKALDRKSIHVILSTALTVVGIPVTFIALYPVISIITIFLRRP